MDRYRKRPVVIEAVQLSKTNWREIEALAPDKIQCLGNRTGPSENELDCIGLNVRTLNGFVFVQIGEWILRGVEGEFYPCTDEIFTKTYERVEDV